MMIFKFNTVKQMTNRFKIKYGYISILFSLCLSTISFSAIAADKTIDGIAAVVNSDVIMVSELRSAAQQFQSQATTKTNEQQLFKEVLEKLIMDKLQVQKAKEIGIKIDDAAVDTAMETIAKQNNLNLQQLRVAIIQRGLDYKVFRESIRDRLYSDNLRKRQQGQSSEISENEIDNLIQSESFNLSKNVQYELIDFILPNTTKSVKDFNMNLNRAQNLRKRLLLNANLSNAELAKLGATKKKLGWKNANSLSPLFSRTLSLMGEGEFSNVIRDTQGLHVLKLVSQKGGKREQTQEALVRHILISKDKPQAKLLVTQLRNKILAGENFGKLAQKYSDDKGSGKNGGELPMGNTERYVAPFKQAANTLPVNVLSQPVQTTFGWHIIEVLERRTSDKTRETIKDQAKQLVGTKKRDEGLKNWLKTLRDEAFVEYRIKL